MGSNPGFTELMEKRKEADDVYDYSYSLRNSLKRLDESETLSEGDKDIIREFLEHLSAKRVSTGRLAKYGFTVRRLTEHTGVPIRVPLGTASRGNGISYSTSSVIRYYTQFGPDYNTVLEVDGEIALIWSGTLGGQR